MLDDYSNKVLLEIAGYPQTDLRWGAAMSMTLEFLSGSGYLTRFEYKLTEKGKRVVDELRSKQEAEASGNKQEEAGEEEGSIREVVRR